MRRIATYLLLILPVAALLNLGVAWLIAWRYESVWIVDRSTADFTEVRTDGSWWQGRLQQAFLTLQMQVAFDDKWTGGPESHDTLAQFTNDLPWVFRSEVLDWCGGLANPKPRNRCMMMVARGWPCPAFGLRRDYDQRTNSFTIHGGWPIRVETTRKRGGLELPLTPMCPGLALNVMVYSLILVLAFVNVRILRQWRRFGRGRCPKCSYDLRGDLATGCSECGWRRRTTSHSTGTRGA